MWGLSFLTVWNPRPFLTIHHNKNTAEITDIKERPVDVFVAHSWAWLRFATYNYLQQPRIVRKSGDRRPPYDLIALEKPLAQLILQAAGLDLAAFEKQSLGRACIIALDQIDNSCLLMQAQDAICTVVVKCRLIGMMATYLR
jgi:hypothetical protein